MSQPWLGFLFLACNAHWLVLGYGADMPELPEVETTTKKLQLLVGRQIKSFSGDWPRGARISTLNFIARDIRGREIISISRTGKSILFRLGRASEKGAERILAFHQRMSGRLIVKPKNNIRGTKLKEADKHIRVKIKFRDGDELWFHDARKFGVVWYGKPEEVMRDTYFASLGADALTVSFKEFRERLIGHNGMIKAILLRQDIFAGIGNIVADEMLWDAKIHPKRNAANLSESEVRALFSAMKTVLKRSIKAQGTTLRDWGHPDGESGNFQNLMRVYGQKGKLCRRCGHKISRMVVGGRGTWICAYCQSYR